MRIGILTGGGDAPGLNGIIESASKSLLSNGHEVVGIVDGFEGIFNSETINICSDTVKGLHAQAGTLLGTSNKSRTEGREDEFIKKYEALKLDGLIAAGGDGTFAGLSRFKDKINLIGVPKTIDNDLQGTDVTFGFDTACSLVSESVDSLRATAHAHKRIIVVETMGRTAGWIALGGGLTSYADAILIPERPFNKKALLNFVREKKKSQRGFLCVVSEGAFAKGDAAEVDFEVEDSPQAERFGGIGKKLARWFDKETGWESRQVVLGHLQRSKSPTATDRFLTLAMGLEVAKLAHNKEWGKAAVYKNGMVQSAPLADIMKPARLVESDHRWVKMAQQLGIFI